MAIAAASMAFRVVPPFSPPFSPTRSPLLTSITPIRAASDDPPTDNDPSDSASSTEIGVEDPGFEERLAKLQRRRSGKKAEKRKALKESYAATTGKGNVLLPPVPLQDSISDGLPVGLGFNSYSERVNGRFAALGLAAILLVELATGGSFLKYHESSVIGIQLYFMLAASALFIKFEKEKISVWPKS